ncbi:hypothetical protein BCV72DRAFT_24475 [Rhizopus microsporus var. microsporus]|uniref:Uncharacterized protein n=1 Tax=Rhizopus microsporus var. microsporus TaxID=86635 RepID=A0A1X0QVT6_RHIZD|nr:hypothetical protein BCV72DRAFT_24475 [Rhizopus microsporus var. microsporus]
MTTIVKPTIKLPPRNNNKSLNNTIRASSQQQQQQQDMSLKEIFFEDTENRVSDIEIQNLLQEFKPIQIKRERGGGYLSFQDSKIAEKVYAFFNGYIFPSSSVTFNLSLSGLQPEGPFLEIRNLSLHIDHHQLYDLCRPYGLLSMCKVITEDNAQKKRALVQYFTKQDSDIAQNTLNSKMIEGSSIQVAVLMASHVSNSRYSTQQQQPQQFVEKTQNGHTGGGFVDLMNLYVKNLDPTINDIDLFNLFRQFGRIVSARVMTNPATRQSKGYGFVSYGKPEEAALALNQMDGMLVRSKQIIVAYHEPKKPRQEKSSSTTTSSFHSPPSTAPPMEYVTAPYFETRHPHEGIENMDQITLKELSVGTTIPMQRKISLADIGYHPPNRTSPQFQTSRPSLASLASGASIHPVPHHLEHVPEERTLRRKKSLESVSSVMTESSAQVQRIKMTEAVKRCGSFGSELDDIVDMLLTLKRKERSICLFNPDFLKEKINAAIEALEIFDDKQEEPEVVVRKPSLPKKVTISPSCLRDHAIIPPPRTSKAIPIVAPPSPEETAKMTEIKNLLNSFEGKPIHERKQLLGDQLFPLVKATGVKHAPKITIRLLDTIELEELAKIMFNKDLLKAQVDKAAAANAAGSHS